MNIKQNFITSLFIFIFLGFFYPHQAVAQNNTCTLTPNTLNAFDKQASLTVDGLFIKNNSEVSELWFYCSGETLTPTGPTTKLSKNQLTFNANGSISFNVSNCFGAFCALPCWHTKPFFSKPRVQVVNNSGIVLCKVNDIPVIEKFEGKICSIAFDPNPPDPGDSYTVILKNLPIEGADYLDLREQWNNELNRIVASLDITKSSQGIDRPGTDVGTTVLISVTGKINGVDYGPNNPFCKNSFVVGTTPALNQEPGPGDTTSLGTTQICNFIQDDGQRGLCNECFTRPGVWTPFGCIETDPQLFVEKILKIAIGMAGGIAFLMIVYGGFVTMMSSGNPEKLTEGREIITSAIAGLLLIVFSVVILKIIGVDILGIPGL